MASFDAGSGHSNGSGKVRKARMSKKERKDLKAGKAPLPKLLLLRGHSGSGKTTLATWYEENHGYKSFAADDYFYRNGEYEFNPNELPKAHEDCIFKTKLALEQGHNVVVHNTFSCKWEMDPYFQMSNRAKISVWKLVSEYPPDKQIHPQVIQNQKQKYETYSSECKVTFNKDNGEVLFY